MKLAIPYLDPAGLAPSLDEGRGSMANSPSHGNLDYSQEVLHHTHCMESERKRRKEPAIILSVPSH